MEAFLVSIGIVALAEVGDKTQLLAFVLAARFRGATGAIILGILTATVINHAFAAIVGTWLAGTVSPELLRWLLGLSFIAMGIWVLVPDKLEDKDTCFPALGVFRVTLLAFFCAEMGDKTQVATAALAAQYGAFIPVVVGTTLGMMVANVPAVLVGERLSNPAMVKAVHGVAAVMFVLLGVAALSGAGARFGI